MTVDNGNAHEVRCAISLVEAALNQCDKAGLSLAAIDISTALDKLKAMQAELENALPEKVLLGD